MRRERYFLFLWAFTAATVVGLYTLQGAIGGRMPPDMGPWMLFVFFEWIALTPLGLRLARRFDLSHRLRAVAVHAPAAAAFAFVALVLHKLVLCPAHDYVACVTAYELRPWFFSWILSGGVIYAGTLSGIWLLDAAKERAVAASRMDAELAAEELRLARVRIDPQTIAAAFQALASRLATDADGAEEMIAALADELRAAVRESVSFRTAKTVRNPPPSARDAQVGRGSFAVCAA